MISSAWGGDTKYQIIIVEEILQSGKSCQLVNLSVDSTPTQISNYTQQNH